MKVKIALVLALLSALGLARTQGEAPQDFQRLKGCALPKWDFPKDDWMNTAQPLKLADLRGSVVLVEVFRIECSHCKEAAPARRALFERYRLRGLKMVGIQSPGVNSPDERDWENVQKTVKSWKLEYPIAFDDKGQYFQKVLRGDTYPTAFVLNRNGEVRFVQTGFSVVKAAQLDRAIASELKNRKNK